MTLLNMAFSYIAFLRHHGGITSSSLFWPVIYIFVAALCIGLLLNCVSGCLDKNSRGIRREKSLWGYMMLNQHEPYNFTGSLRTNFSV